MAKQTRTAPLILTTIMVVYCACISWATTDDNTSLANHGLRLGWAYSEALKAGDTEKQADIITEFNDILKTLRKQEQADILVNAFNNCTVPITNPETDAILYSRALMNAHAKADSTAIADASDIAKTVRNIYLSNRNEQEAVQFAQLYECAVSGARLGNEYSFSDEVNGKAIKTKTEQTRNNLCAGDSLSVKAFNDSFDYHSIRLTTPENDAEIYSEQMIAATKSGIQSSVNFTARIIGFVYEHYCFERNNEEADRFNSLINKLIEKGRD